MASLQQVAADMPLLVASANSSSERRITPAWSIAHFKDRLEPITGIPASAQKLSLRIGSQDPVALEATDEQSTRLASFPLQAYAEIYVSVFPYLVQSASTFLASHRLRSQPSLSAEWKHATCAVRLNFRATSMPHPGLLAFIGSTYFNTFFLRPWPQWKSVTGWSPASPSSRARLSGFRIVYCLVTAWRVVHAAANR
jgi:hypothetical protein